MGKKPNHQKVSDETYQERYFLFLREQLVRLDKEFKSSFEKTKELQKRYQEAINNKSFVGKELTELQRVRSWKWLRITLEKSLENYLRTRYSLMIQKLLSRPTSN